MGRDLSGLAGREGDGSERKEKGHREELGPDEIDLSVQGSLLGTPRLLHPQFPLRGVEVSVPGEVCATH